MKMSKWVLACVLVSSATADALTFSSLVARPVAQSSFTDLASRLKVVPDCDVIINASAKTWHQVGGEMRRALRVRVTNRGHSPLYGISVRINAQMVYLDGNGHVTHVPSPSGWNGTYDQYGVLESAIAYGNASAVDIILPQDYGIMDGAPVTVALDPQQSCLGTQSLSFLAPRGFAQ